MRENRRYERVHPGFRCWCEGQNVTVYALVEDLSEGGLHLKVAPPLEEGSLALVRLPLPGSWGIPARVVWRRGGGEGAPPGMGLEFAAMPPEALQQIRTLVHHEPPPVLRIG